MCVYIYTNICSIRHRQYIHLWSFVPLHMVFNHHEKTWNTKLLHPFPSHFIEAMSQQEMAPEVPLVIADIAGCLFPLSYGCNRVLTSSDLVISFQWTGLRENLQDSPIFNGKNVGFLQIFPYTNPLIHRLTQSWHLSTCSKCHESRCDHETPHGYTCRHGSTQILCSSMVCITVRIWQCVKTLYPWWTSK